MRFADTVTSAVKGVTVNLSRSALTMLGIVIGVGAVVLMSGIGASMEGVILSQISSLGPTSMVIFPGKQEGGPNAVATGHDSLTFGDIEALKRLSTVTNVAPVVFLGGTITSGRETTSSRVFGTTPAFFDIYAIRAVRGRLFDVGDEEGAKQVAVLGPDAAADLFGDQDPLGQRVTIGESSFQVIGVTNALGTQFFQNADDRLYVPLSVAKSLSGQDYVNYVPMMATSDFDTAFADVKWVLRDRHGISNPDDDPDKDDFVVRNSQQANEILSGVSLGLTLFIMTIAAISLVVGGIGIMNIMLVTVTERTREIGLRKALGARSGDILRQFLIEAVFLTVLGGLVGVALGVGGAYLAAVVVRSFLATYQFAISLPAILAALAMAGLTGLVFGLTPARRAAALSPMEALRYE
jgi:putative ABC transport system permease protein